MNAAFDAHLLRAEALAEALRTGSGTAALAKPTSNLFRDRRGDARRRLDVGGFCEVLRVDRAAGTVDAEGMVTYEALVEACMRASEMPAVVPQLKTITLGGAVAGVGIEATSHRHGLVHETVSEIEVLTGDGRIVVCTPDNEHSDLFFGFPNSYGTLGYALRVRAKTIPVLPYVHVEHHPFTSPEDFFEAIESHCMEDRPDFIDGTIFAADRLYLTIGRFAATAPFTSDYTFENIYYRSIPQNRQDWLSVRDFLWRWDTDWFWCSKNVFAQNPVVRRLYGRKRLGSRTYSKIMRWNTRLGITRALERVAGIHSESVIQDVDIPIERAVEFLEFYVREIGILPVWICPIAPGPRSERFTLYPMQRQLYVNFGFWDVIRTRARHEPGHFNRMVERKVAELEGIKSLYSDSYFDAAEFDHLYGGESYRRLKSLYDPGGTFPTLFEKCVMKR